MTRITYNGLVYVKINKSDWEFEGGDTNPDLLKLVNKRPGSRGHRYFKLRAGLNVGTVEQASVMTEDEKFLASFDFNTVVE